MVVEGMVWTKWLQHKQNKSCGHLSSLLFALDACYVPSIAMSVVFISTTSIHSTIELI